MKRLLLLVPLAFALAVAGCGGGGDTTATPETVQGTLPATTEAAGGGGDPAAGKKVFADAGCGGCHTLADAGTNGQVGPNLDDAKPEAALVVDRVTNGMGPMPAFKDKLTEKQIQDVAAYVSSVAGSS